jgi:hypothetical protein
LGIAKSNRVSMLEVMRKLFSAINKYAVGTSFPFEVTINNPKPIFISVSRQHAILLRAVLILTENGEQ